MKSVLQLCCFTNLFPNNFSVTSVDLKLGSNIFDINQSYASKFDIIVAAPPCTQFTIANNRNWVSYPSADIAIAEHCLYLCQFAKDFWFLENPPGRICSFLPILKNFRILNYFCLYSNKVYVVYSNKLFLSNSYLRYGKLPLPHSKFNREKWVSDLITNLILLQ
jgi:hypothetical protein